MICLRFTHRAIAVFLFLEVYFSLVIANDFDQVPRAQNQKNVNKPSTPKKCKPIRIPNGKPKQPIKGQIVHYICNPGYKMYGIPILTCDDNGRWSQPLPSCIASGCPEIPRDGPLKMKPIPPLKAVLTTLNFSCASGFVLSIGPSTIQCSKTRWNGRLPRCLEIPDPTTIAPKEVPKTGIRFTVTYNPPTEEATTRVKSVKSTTSTDPAVDEKLTSAHVEISLSAFKTPATSRIMIATVTTENSSLPVSTRVSSSAVERSLPISTTTEALLLQSDDVSDLKPHRDLKADTSTSPLSDGSTRSDLLLSTSHGRIKPARAFSGGLTGVQTISTSEMLHEDGGTTEAYKLFPEEPGEETRKTASASDQTTSRKSLKITDSVVSISETHLVSSEMVSEREAQDDRTLETHTFSSDMALTLDKLREESEDGVTEIHAAAPESDLPHKASTSQESWTVQFNSFRKQDPTNEAEAARTTVDTSLQFSFSSSFMEESEEISVPKHDDSKVTESDAEGPWSLIVTHVFNEEYEEDKETTIRPTDSSSSVESLVLRSEKMPLIHGNETEGSRSKAASTTQVPPSRPSGSKPMRLSAPVMTSKDHVSVVLIVIIVAAIIVLLALLFILGKALKPKCTLRPKPCHESAGAVPYTEQLDQSDHVVLKSVTSIYENNSCTSV